MISKVSLFYKNIFLKCFLFIFLAILLFAVMQKKNNLFSSERKENLNSKYKNYNVVLIILDALRPDYLGCYEYPKKVSPNIDRLSNRSIIFKNAFCHFPVTFPSTTSIFTSLYPFSHGTIEIFKDRVPERVYTMAQILNIYGYNTAWFGELGDAHTGGAKDHLLKGYNDIKEIDYNNIFKWIEENKTKPFFITIHSYSVHEGVFPLERFNNNFSRKVSKELYELLDGIKEKQWYIFQDRLNNKPDEIYRALGREWVERHSIDFSKPYSKEIIWKLSAESENPERFFTLDQFFNLSLSYYHSIVRGFDKKQLSDYLLLLDSTIFETDRSLIGGLISSLKNYGLDRKTLIIITADHGNEFLEHGGVGHGGQLYDESIHVPLILFLPDLVKGKRVKELAQSIDILPTLLDLLGIPVPYQAQGISLVGLIEGSKSTLINEYVISQTGGSFCIRSRDWKYIKDNIKEELYDLRHDKNEKNNLINKRYKIIEDLKKRLDSTINSLAVYKNRESEFLPFIDEKTRKNIKKTGYW